jgi:hypothetical protein
MNISLYAGWIILQALSSFFAGIRVDLRPASVLERVPSAFTENLQHDDQDSGQGGLNLKVNVNLVTVDVLVRDEWGDPIGSFKAENFAVLDNGHGQQLTLFSQDKIPLAVALVIDASDSITPYLPVLRSTAMSVLGRLGPQDQVALFFFDRLPHRVTDLTQDRYRIALLTAKLMVGGETNVSDAIFEAARIIYRRLEAEANGAATNGIPFAVAWTEIMDTKGKRYLKVDLHIDPARVKFSSVDVRHIGALYIGVFLANRTGDTVCADYKCANLVLPEAAYQQFIKSGIPLSSLIPYDGTHRILKVVVYDVLSQRTGSTFVTIS